MDSNHLLVDVVILLTAALLVGLLFERLRQSSIVGCIIAGTLVGPSVLGWVQTEDLTQIAELGVSLLLFSLGLEVSWRRFASFGVPAIGGGVLQIIVTTLLVALVARLMGAAWPAGLALGAIASVSSTATVLRTLQQRAEVDSLHGRLALGILIVQDVAVVPLVLLVTYLGAPGGPAEIIAALGTAAGKGAGLVIALMLGAYVVVPRLFNMTLLARNRELPVILAVVTWLASTWAAHALGLSSALGAFVAGMLLAESPFAHQIRADVAPFRIAFVTLFFASLGLLADLGWLMDPQHLLWVVVLVFMIMIGKAIIIWAVCRPFGTPNRTGLAAGLALGQIGEFSFVLAAIAQGNGLFDQAGNMFQLVVNSTLITLVLTPILVSRSSEVAGKIEQWMLRWKLWKAPVVPAGTRSQHQLGHVIVIGYGPSGQAVVQALHEADFDVVVLDLNPRLIAAAKANALEAHLADASRRETLEELGLDRARACVITIPHHETALSVISQLRLLSPRLPVVVRARYQTFVDLMQRNGATVVVDEEAKVGELLGKAAVQAAFDDVLEELA